MTHPKPQSCAALDLFADSVSLALMGANIPSRIANNKHNQADFVSINIFLLY